jgi:hypothetical protein
MRIARRAGPRKAKVALARKLAVVMHRMLADGTPFVAQKAVAAQQKEKLPVRVVGKTDGPGARSRRPGRRIRSSRKMGSEAARLSALELDWPADPYQTP